MCPAPGSPPSAAARKRCKMLISRRSGYHKLAIGVLAVFAAIAPAKSRAKDATLCEVGAADEFVDAACRLASAVGEPSLLPVPEGEAVSVRLFISRPFKLPSIVRVDIRSSRDASLSIRSMAPGWAHKAIRLNTNEIAAIQDQLNRSEFSQSIGTGCDPYLFLLAEEVKHDAYRSGFICNRAHADRFPVGPMIDEIMRNKLNFKG